jgi:hypothetical protein
MAVMEFSDARLESRYCADMARHTFSQLDPRLYLLFVAFNLLYNLLYLGLFLLGFHTQLGLSWLDVLYMAAIALHYLAIRAARRGGQYARHRNAIVAACRCGARRRTPGGPPHRCREHRQHRQHRPPPTPPPATSRLPACLRRRVMYGGLGAVIIPAWSDWAPDAAVATLGAFNKHLITTSGVFFQNWLAVGSPCMSLRARGLVPRAAGWMAL